MTLNEITLEILAERALTQFDSKKLVDWAVNVLEIGYESKNLCILAGLDFDSTEEREEYFCKSIEDLKLDVEKTDDELIEKYAMTIANRAIQKEISVDYAFSQMRKIVSATGYDRRYIAFYEIDEGLDYLTYDNSVLYHSGLTIENSNDFILEEFKIFVQMENLKIPLEERNKCYCKKCKMLNYPITKNRFQLKKPFKYMVWSCGICGSEKLKFNNNHEVKRMIIDEYKNTKAYD
jgi:RNase P subunit RPR2